MKSAKTFSSITRVRPYDWKLSIISEPCYDSAYIETNFAIRPNVIAYLMQCNLLIGFFFAQTAYLRSSTILY